MSQYSSKVSIISAANWLAAILGTALWCACQTDAAPTSTTIADASDTATIHATLKKAQSFLNSNPDSATHFIALAKAQSSRAGYANGMAKAKAYEASYLRRKGLYEEAIATQLEAIKSFDSLDNYAELAKNQSTLADMYKELGGEKKTMPYLEKGIELAKTAEATARIHQLHTELIYALNERGIIYRDMSTIGGRTDYMDSAFAMYEQAIAIVAEHPEANEPLNKLYNNISQIYNEHYKNYPEALAYLQKAVAINKEKNNIRSLSFNYGNISDVYLNMRNLPQADYYAQQTLALCTSLGVPHRMQNAYSQLVRVKKAMHQYDSALFYKELFIAINDSITNLDRTQQIADVQTKYETREKESQIAILDASVQSKNRQMYMAVAVGVLLVAMIGFMFYQNRQLSLQKNKVSEQSNRLQLMMKELHHRVKNNLQIVSSLLNLQSYKLKDSESLDVLKKGQLRVQAMSLMHQRLYQVEDVSLLNFREYVTDVTDTLMKSYGFAADDFDLQIDIDQEMMDVDTAMPLGLLVNEILTNAFKYAYANVQRPMLHIHMQSAPESFQLIIRDNGPGMNQQSKPTQEGFGRKLIAALTKQLKGSYSTHDRNGTEYIFKIPYTAPKAA